MTRYRRRPGINETPVEDELFLIAGNSGHIYHLDQLAMSIWRALEQPASKEDLQVLFAEAFPDTLPGAIDQDLTAAMDVLLSGRLIEPCD
ncbi:MAG: PqqD family protein [Rhodospirillaceae bacterium]|jgi:hypothetical protein|nr:PqqD family protein [Rhodospirillaceae bacterium]MBT4043908.1 PqqD family protein [Rhodospirillaceae bacterium]MBT4689035.1 PqqD family protein [Rhodospirillaceae bacterium]MBT5082140.1 PqqD family protein [Rhodospirillaceae bacterium]MBT5523613.1 PqqD family protein [Rhodospirillaceae bacterium]